MSEIAVNNESFFFVFFRKIRTFRMVLKNRILIFVLNIFGRRAPSILIAFLWGLSFYRVKGIRCRSRSRAKILVLDKSIGTLDIIATFSTPADYDVRFISRSMIKNLAKHFLGGVVGDHDYKNNDGSVELSKLDYRSKLEKVIYWLNRIFDVRVLVSFNPTYYAERELTLACEQAGVRFVILNKESNGNETVWDEAVQIIQSEIKTFNGSFILPYNNLVRNAYIKSGIVSADKVIVTGCPRLDFAHNLRNNKKSGGKKYVLYYMTNPLAGLGLTVKKGGRFHTMKMSGRYDGIWTENIQQLNKAFAELVSENPDIDFVVKGKIGFFRNQESQVKQDIDFEQMKNVQCISGGSGEKLLEDASVVIAFNSVTVYEAIAAGIPVVTPRLKMKQNEFYEQFAHDVCGATLCPTTADDFKAAVITAHTEKLHYQELSDRQLEVLEKDMGNSDGRAGARVKEVLDSLMR